MPDDQPIHNLAGERYAVQPAYSKPMPKKEEGNEAMSEAATHAALAHLGLGFLAEIISAGKLMNGSSGGRRAPTHENLNPSAAYKPGVSFLPGGRKN